MTTDDTAAKEDRPSYLEETANKLWWLTDVPTFMDERLVDGLFSAIIRPEYILLQSSETAEQTRNETSATELAVGGGISFPAFWKISAA